MKATAILGPQGFRTEVRIGDHSLISDEPVEKGGGNEGPTALSLLGAALSACTAATLRYYANMKQMPLVGVEVEVEVIRRSPAELTASGPTAKATLTRKKITLIGESLTAEQRERLLAVAEKCPVNRALIDGVDMQKV